MSEYKKFLYSTLCKFIVIPLVITLVSLFAVNALLPSFESRLPNGTEYSVQAEAEDKNE